MQTATDYRILAAACRRAANLSAQTAPSLLKLADKYEREAEELEAKSLGQRGVLAWALGFDRREKPRR